jgi:hypothetical protein
MFRMSKPQPKYPRMAAAIRARIGEDHGAPTRLSEQIGVEVSVVCRWCRGEARPTGDNFHALTTKSAVTADDVYADSRAGSEGAEASGGEAA